MVASTAGGSAYQNFVFPLTGWAEYSTTRPLETIKMVLQSHHQIMLHQQKKSCQLLAFHQVTNLCLTSFSILLSLFFFNHLLSQQTSQNYFQLFCPVTASKKQGLTKVETIQVKGNNYSHNSRVKVLFTVNVWMKTFRNENDPVILRRNVILKM